MLLLVLLLLLYNGTSRVQPQTAIYYVYFMLLFVVMSKCIRLDRVNVWVTAPNMRLAICSCTSFGWLCSIGWHGYKLTASIRISCVSAFVSTHYREADTMVSSRQSSSTSSICKCVRARSLRRIFTSEICVSHPLKQQFSLITFSLALHRVLIQFGLTDTHK